MEMYRQRSGSLLLVLLVLCGAPFMASLDVFVVNVAFPALRIDFEQSALSDLSWVLNIYAIVYAALLIPLGRWADSFGVRRVFLLGLALFTLGSLAAALGTTLPVLLAARAVQAIGAAALTPASLGLLLKTVPEQKRAFSVRVWVTASAVGSALGPLIGGLLVEVSWRWVFIINVPLGVVLIALAFSRLPAGETTTATRVNLLGAALSAVAAGALSLGLVNGSEWGWSSLSTGLCLLVFLLASGALVLESIKSRAPLIPAAIMRVRSFSWANATMLLFSASFAAGLLGLSMWLQNIWHFAALQTGLAIAPGPLMVPIFALGGQRLLARIRPATLVAVGSLLWAIGIITILLSVDETPNYAGAVLPGWVIAGIGVGLVLPTVLASSTISLPSQYASSGSAVINMTRQIGTVIGVSAFVSVIAVAHLSTLEAFRIAWWVTAGFAGVSAITALGIRSPAPNSPHL